MSHMDCSRSVRWLKSHKSTRPVACSSVYTTKHIVDNTGIEENASSFELLKKQNLWRLKVAVRNCFWKGRVQIRFKVILQNHIELS